MLKYVTVNKSRTIKMHRIKETFVVEKRKKIARKNL